MFVVLHINGHFFSLLLVNMFLSLVVYDNLLYTNMNDDDDVKRQFYRQVRGKIGYKKS